MARAALALLCLTACAHEASTRTPDPVDTRANELKERASKASDARAWGQAYALYNQAYALEPLPATAVSIATAAARLGQTDNAFEWLHTAIDSGFTAVHWLKDPDLASLKGDPRWAALPARIKPRAEAHARALNVGGGLERVTPQQARIDGDALQALLTRAEQTGTAGLVVLRDGRLVGDWYFGNWSRLIETMSVTQSVAVLAVGFLLDEKKLESLDEPLWHYFPELRQGLKEKLTVRHLLTHTSGLQALDDTSDISRASDFVRLALAADLESEPGTRFRHNNKAANLLAGVVERASGQRLDAYLTQKLFGPLGIKDVQWTHDKGGNPHGMSGLQLHPLDLAKIGQLVLDSGRWQGTSLLSTAFLETATRKPGTSLTTEAGLLWWLTWEKNLRRIPAGASLKLRAASAETLKAVKQLEGRWLPVDEFWNQLAPIADKDAFVAELERAGTPLERDASGLRSIEARGDRGQYLILFPAERLVGVRLTEADDDSQALPELGALLGNLTTKN